MKFENIVLKLEAKDEVMQTEQGKKDKEDRKLSYFRVDYFFKKHLHILTILAILIPEIGPSTEVQVQVQVPEIGTRVVLVFNVFNLEYLIIIDLGNIFINNDNGIVITTDYIITTEVHFKIFVI